MRWFYNPCYRPESECGVGNYPNLKKEKQVQKEIDLLTVPGICLALLLYGLQCIIWPDAQSKVCVRQAEQIWRHWDSKESLAYGGTHGETDVTGTWTQVLWFLAQKASTRHGTVPLTNLSMVRSSGLRPRCVDALEPERKKYCCLERRIHVSFSVVF